MNTKLAQRDLKTKFGTFSEILYYDGQRESIALVMGDVAGAEDVLCRVHSSCLSAHIFNSIECECREEMEISQFLIEQKGQGVIIWLDQEGKGNGHLALMESIQYKLEGFSQAEAYEKAGYEKDARNFRPAAQILVNLGVKSVTLLTNNPAKAEELRKESIAVSSTQPMVIAEDSIQSFEEKLKLRYADKAKGI